MLSRPTMIHHRYLALFLMLAFAGIARAQKSDTGSVTGTVTDQASNRPIEFAAIVLKDASGKAVQRSASDLLQNVPSVDVDIEGNVSLRGDSNVLILIDGRTSAMMGANRAAVLQQMPADGIEKIEVITNPSAKYRPDGTAGIINITLKKKQEPGYSGNVRVSAGNDRRYNAGVTANYNPGKYNLYGSASV